MFLRLTNSLWRFVITETFLSLLSLLSLAAWPLTLWNLSNFLIGGCERWLLIPFGLVLKDPKGPLMQLEDWIEILEEALTPKY